MNLLSVHNLTKSYAADHGPVVDGVSFHVRPGEIVVLLGPSGCGKTTVLRLIAGFEHADRGRIELDGRTLTATWADGGAAEARPVFIRPEDRNIGFVFQDYALFPHINVVKNVMYGLRGPRAARRRRAAELLRLVGMADYARRRPHELSGGQQQRVALARSLGPSPKLVLLDEPFSNLDASMRANTRREVRKLLHEQDMAAILVTHDQEEALTFADRIAVMRHGRVVQVGTPDDVYERPDSAFAAAFVGQTNLLRLEAEGREAGSVIGRLPLDRAATGRVTVSIRPEHLRLTDPGDGGGGGEVVSREYKGHDLTYRVNVHGHALIVQTDYQCPFQPGDRVGVRSVEPAVVVERER